MENDWRRYCGIFTYNKIADSAHVITAEILKHSNNYDKYADVKLYNTN